MFGFIILACNISFTTSQLECNWIVKETFKTESACQVYEKNYSLRRGEQLGICDELKEGVKVGDKRKSRFITK